MSDDEEEYVPKSKRDEMLRRAMPDIDRAEQVMKIHQELVLDAKKLKKFLMKMFGDEYVGLENMLKKTREKLGDKEAFDIFNAIIINAVAADVTGIKPTAIEIVYPAIIEYYKGHYLF